METITVMRYHWVSSIKVVPRNSAYPVSLASRPAGSWLYTSNGLALLCRSQMC